MKTASIVVPKGMHRDTFENRLADWGYTFGGSGLYAQVYVHEKKKRAVKIGPKDDAYLIFVKAVWKLQNDRKKRNPYLPKIYELTIRSTWYAVEMELLKPLYGSGLSKEANKLMGAVSSVVDRCYESCPRDVARYVQQFSPHVWELAAIIGITMCHDSCPDLDLHNYNVMVRGSQLVVTDPLAG